jgi:hypothetical protein
MALTSLTSGIVRSQTQAMKFFFFLSLGVEDKDHSSEDASEFHKTA